MSDKRIYVIITQTVSTIAHGDVQQPLGRQMAQACHVVSKMRLIRHIDKVWGRPKKPTDFIKINPNALEPFTTVCLCVRDSKELDHIWNLLRTEEIPFEWFQDDNLVAYGPGLFNTAICTYPIEPEAVMGILDYLPLWGSDRHLSLIPKGPVAETV